MFDLWIKPTGAEFKKRAYLPGLLLYFESLALTSSYVRKATYPGCVTASTFQFRSRLHHGWNNLQGHRHFVRARPHGGAIPWGNWPCEDVKLKAGDVIVAGKVNGGFQGHGFQRRADLVNFDQRLPEMLPRHNCSARQTCARLKQIFWMVLDSHYVIHKSCLCPCGQG